MPTFTKEEIVHLGDLARIALTDEEITRLQGDLNVIAESINKVQEVATDDVEPTANPIPSGCAGNPADSGRGNRGRPGFRSRHVCGTAHSGGGVT